MQFPSIKLLFIGLGMLSSLARATADRVEIDASVYSLQRGLLNSVFAKELCSCLYVDKLTRKECDARDNLPRLVHWIVKITTQPKKMVTVEFLSVPKIEEIAELFGLAEIEGIVDLLKLKDFKLGPPATAEYVSDDFGCRIKDFPLNTK